MANGNENGDGNPKEEEKEFTLHGGKRVKKMLFWSTSSGTDEEEVEGAGRATFSSFFIYILFFLC